MSVISATVLLVLRPYKLSTPGSIYALWRNSISLSKLKLFALFHSLYYPAKVSGENKKDNLLQDCPFEVMSG
jgi:hypothetical protein